MDPSDPVFKKAVEQYVAEKGGHDFYANRVDPYASTIDNSGSVILKRKKTLEILGKYPAIEDANKKERENSEQSSFQRVLLEERESESLYTLTCKDGRYTLKALSEYLQVIDRKKNQACNINWRDIKAVKPHWANPRCIYVDISADSIYPLWVRSVAAHVVGMTQCKEASSELDNIRRRLAAERAIAEQRELANTDQSYLATIVSAINVDAPEGVPAEVTFGINTIQVRICDVNHVAEIDVEDVIKIEISGPGTVTTNAGLVGGGLGFEGAAWGIAAASIINAMTTTSTTNTFVTIATRHSSLTLHTSQYDTEALRMRLSSRIAAAESRSNLPPKPADTDILSKIKELAELKAQGLLSEEEFTFAKMKILEP
jgi:hypothetical protein